MCAETNQLIDNLNHAELSVRLDSLMQLMWKIKNSELERPVSGQDVNNHIHTFYSFSPYSPTKAIWMAYTAGLATAGIMDHDSISGAEEFIDAGKITGIATTIGVECRADMSKTPLNGRRINNPDQNSIAYVALHGIPHTQIEKVKAFFRPYTQHRNTRNCKMVEKINKLIEPNGFTLNFENDVVPVSNFKNGGSITERHILYALALKLISHLGKGQALVGFLRDTLHLNISAKLEGCLTDMSNPHYEYDLLGLLKSELVSSIYVDAAEECPDITEIIRLADSIGAISAYAYLGDVGNSVTGDKKAQKFEDDYIEELFTVLKDLGFKAVTYMPSRNSMAQLDRVMALCEKHSFFQISGEDINSSRQSFICMAMRDEKFRNLYDAAWALIGHERAATEDLKAGMFSPETIRKYPVLGERIRVYAEMGRRVG
jgi:hypothetical protein